MSEHDETPSDIIEISRMNGDFKKNYGALLGAFLYLRSLSAARGRSMFWVGIASSSWSVIAAWLTKCGVAW
jgi:hypothetical protein